MLNKLYTDLRKTKEAEVSQEKQLNTQKNHSVIERTEE